VLREGNDWLAADRALVTNPQVPGECNSVVRLPSQRQRILSPLAFPFRCPKFFRQGVLRRLLRLKLPLLLIQLGRQLPAFLMGFAERFDPGLVGQRPAGAFGFRYGFLGVIPLLPVFGDEPVRLGNPRG